MQHGTRRPRAGQARSSAPRARQPTLSRHRLPRSSLTSASLRVRSGARKLRRRARLFLPSPTWAPSYTSKTPTSSSSSPPAARNCCHDRPSGHSARRPPGPGPAPPPDRPAGPGRSTRRRRRRAARPGPAPRPRRGAAQIVGLQPPADGPPPPSRRAAAARSRNHGALARMQEGLRRRRVLEPCSRSAGRQSLHQTLDQEVVDGHARTAARSPARQSPARSMPDLASALRQLRRRRVEHAGPSRRWAPAPRAPRRLRCARRQQTGQEHGAHDATGRRSAGWRWSRACRRSSSAGSRSRSAHLSSPKL